MQPAAPQGSASTTAAPRFGPRPLPLRLLRRPVSAPVRVQNIVNKSNLQESNRAAEARWSIVPCESMPLMGAGVLMLLNKTTVGHVSACQTEIAPCSALSRPAAWPGSRLRPPRPLPQPPPPHRAAAAREPHPPRPSPAGQQQAESHNSVIYVSPVLSRDPGSCSLPPAGYHQQ